MTPPCCEGSSCTAYVEYIVVRCCSLSRFCSLLQTSLTTFVKVLAKLPQTCRLSFIRGQTRTQTLLAALQNKAVVSLVDTEPHQQHNRGGSRSGMWLAFFKLHDAKNKRQTLRALMVADVFPLELPTRTLLCGCDTNQSRVIPRVRQPRSLPPLLDREGGVWLVGGNSECCRPISVASVAHARCDLFLSKQRNFHRWWRAATQNLGVKIPTCCYTNKIYSSKLRLR